MLVLGASTYAFSAVLTVILVGIAVGSLGYAIVRPKNPSLVAFLAVTVVLAAHAGQWTLPHLAQVVGLLRPLRNSFDQNAVICIVISAIFALAPAVAMGAILPAIIMATEYKGRSSGGVVGAILAWNTFGCIIGSAATGSLLFAFGGTRFAFLVAMSAYLVAAALVAFVSRCNTTLAHYRLVVFAAIGATALLAFAPDPVTPLSINMGHCLYGFDTSSTDSELTEMLFFKEGPSANVLVTRAKGQSSLRVNGKVDASTGTTDMATQLGLAFFPRIFAPKATDVLIIGYGSGATSGASLLFPGTRVTCCELEPAVAAAAPFFENINHRPDASDNFRLVIDDARSYLQGTSETFDLIISEPSNPWVDGVAALYTVECFQAAKRRLRSSGILAQWVQLYQMAPQDYALVLNTINAVFTNSIVMETCDGDTLILASDSSLVRSEHDIAVAAKVFGSVPAVMRDLELTFGTNDVRSILCTNFILDRNGMVHFCDSLNCTAINNDTNMLLGFSAPVRLFTKESVPLHTTLIRHMDSKEFVNDVVRWGCNHNQVPAIQIALRRLIKADAYQQVDYIAKALKDLDPDGMTLEALLIESSMRQTQTHDRQQFSRLATESPHKLNQLGVRMWAAGNYSSAVHVFEEMTKIHPNSATAWRNLAVNFHACGRRLDARMAEARARDCDACLSYTQPESDSSRPDSFKTSVE